MRSKYFYKAKDLTALSRVTQLSVEDDGESGVLAPKLQSNKPQCLLLRLREAVLWAELCREGEHHTLSKE